MRCSLSGCDGWIFVMSFPTPKTPSNVACVSMTSATLIFALWERPVITFCGIIWLVLLCMWSSICMRSKEVSFARHYFCWFNEIELHDLAFCIGIGVDVWGSGFSYAPSTRTQLIVRELRSCQCVACYVLVVLYLFPHAGCTWLQNYSGKAQATWMGPNELYFHTHNIISVKTFYGSVRLGNCPFSVVATKL